MLSGNGVFALKHVSLQRPYPANPQIEPGLGACRSFVAGCFKVVARHVLRSVTVAAGVLGNKVLAQVWHVKNSARFVVHDVFAVYVAVANRYRNWIIVCARTARFLVNYRVRTGRPWRRVVGPSVARSVRLKE